MQLPVRLLHAEGDLRQGLRVLGASRAADLRGDDPARQDRRGARS